MASPLKYAIALVLLAFPVLEIALLIKAGSAFGFWAVFFWVGATACLGMYVIRRHGLAAFSKIFDPARSGERGPDPIADTFLAVTGGVFLVFPGLMSDAIGGLLQIPAVRAGLIRAGLTTMLPGGLIRREHYDAGREPDWRKRPRPREADGGLVIEGEYERLEDDPPERSPSRGPPG